MKFATCESSREELLEENAMLREEVRVARRASEITAQLVVQQFVKIEEILLRLEEQARIEQELGRKLADKLQESETREGELARDRQRLEDMQVAALNMMEDIAAAREAAEEATRAKSAFLANMSHEIRTPMTAILGFVELIAEGCARACAFGTKEHHDHLATISRNAGHLLHVINDILDLSKIEAGKLAIELVDCSLIQLIADVQSLMRVRADSRGLTFQLEFAGPIPERITTDPTRVRQILINLVGNAIKFTEQGGVRLITRFVPAGPVAGGQAGEPHIEFAVVDTGIGIAPEQVDLLFQPFAQADSSTTRRFGGTGLGLTITKRLANLLGGGITVESRPQVGSTFRVTIAAAIARDVEFIENPAQATVAVPEDPPTAPAPAAPPIALGCRVLLAEDGPDNQRLIAAVLRIAGAEVTIAEDGRAAVDVALLARDTGRPFDVILMDMQMPVLDGYQATQVLRAREYQGLIIALTAHAMAQDREKCLAAGCDDYATKPIDRRQLIAMIQKHVGTAAAAAP